MNATMRAMTRRFATRCVALALGLLTCVAPVGGLAAPAGDKSAMELFQEGQGHMDAADYGAAIDAFEAALRNVGDDERSDSVRNRLRVELVRAHRKAHGVDGDTTHLNKAKALLVDYRAALGTDQSENLDWARQQEAEIDAALEAAAAAEPEPQPQPQPDPAPEPEPQPEPVVLEPTSTDTGDAPASGRPLIIAGGVALGLGAVGGALMAVGFGRANAAVDTFKNDPEQRDQARDDNRSGNSLGIAGAVTAGVFLTTGAALIVVGVRRNQARKVAVTPTLDLTGRHAGLSIQGRF